jgi:hypothetical protein
MILSNQWNILQEKLKLIYKTRVHNCTKIWGIIGCVPTLQDDSHTSFKKHRIGRTRSSNTPNTLTLLEPVSFTFLPHNMSPWETSWNLQRPPSQTKLIKARKNNWHSQVSETNFSICLDWKTTARKTEEKMVGDRNRPLGLILEWKMMTKT